MTNPKIDHLITLLSHVRKRPGMYFSEGMSPVENFFTGFSLALELSLENSNSQYQTVLANHGLQQNKSIYQQLKERGLDDNDATQCYLSIMIEAFQAENL